ncbi:MAG TPA: DEAD/DEAH box helicase, partial [Thermoplasmatales archaeon]|nr:DEAD/DEAH box helicase [Thermoplasmatales archaeon]
MRRFTSDIDYQQGESNKIKNITRIHHGMKLVYHKGTILVHGDYAIPNTKWDERTGCYRAFAMFYRDIIEYLEESDIPYEDLVLDPLPSPYLTSNIKLRPYQKEAVEGWLKQKRGIIVLPTGSGKTIIAIKIIEEINASTFIVVPTLNLVSQWKQNLERAFGIEVGEYTGQKKDLKPITVSTYNSAYINAENLGNRFMLIIFDEVHHLPAEGYRQIAEMFASPYRLGLTATYEREDGLHKELNRLVGGKVYEKRIRHLAGKYLANYELVRINVDLTEKEREEYEKYRNIFRNYIISKGIEM